MPRLLLPDNAVRILFRSDFAPYIAEITPDDIINTGVPIDDMGRDMEYVKTELESEAIIIEVSGGVAEVTSKPDFLDVKIIDHD